MKASLMSVPPRRRKPNGSLHPSRCRVRFNSPALMTAITINSCCFDRRCDHDFSTIFQTRKTRRDEFPALLNKNLFEFDSSLRNKITSGGWWASVSRNNTRLSVELAWGARLTEIFSFLARVGAKQQGPLQLFQRASRWTVVQGQTRWRYSMQNNWLRHSMWSKKCLAFFPALQSRRHSRSKVIAVDFSRWWTPNDPIDLVRNQREFSSQKIAEWVNRKAFAHCFGIPPI